MKTKLTPAQLKMLAIANDRRYQGQVNTRQDIDKTMKRSSKTVTLGGHQYGSATHS